MPLIISPRIQPWVRQEIVEFFSAERGHAAFWHSAFQEFFYKSFFSNGEELFIIFTGYGQLSVAAAIIHEYHRLFEKHEDRPRAFFLGSCVITTQSPANLNDIIVPTKAFSRSTVATEIASRFSTNTQSGDPWLFNKALREMAQRIGGEKKIVIHHGKIYSHETFFEDFWVSFETDWGHREGYMGGDYECASFVVSCNYIGVPMLAILQATDSRKGGSYVEVPRKEKRETLRKVLDLLRDVIKESAMD